MNEDIHLSAAARLAKLSPGEYRHARKEAAQLFDMTAREIDAAVEVYRRNGQAPNGSAHAEPLAPLPPFQAAEDFIAAYRPRVPLVRPWDLKGGWLYSFTAPTGGGKTAIALAQGLGLAQQGERVVYFAGENADEVRARLILMKSQLDLPRLPDTMRFVGKTFDLVKDFAHAQREIEADGGAALAIVDTSPVFQVAAGGIEENNNPEAIRWAQRLRRMTRLKGEPAVLALCHPTKRPQSIEDCIPRGGGGFLAEVDGNYATWLKTEDAGRKFFDFTWTGKFRGGFERLSYVVDVATCDALTDPEGKPIYMPWAHSTDEQEIERATAGQAEDDDAVLMALADYPGKSLSAHAKLLEWGMPSGPAKYRVERAVKRLTKDGLCKLGRSNRYELTPPGKTEAKRVAERIRNAAK
jgi:hypothetical protein